jgi:lipid-binding SYLF domain-containing protein
MKSKAICARVLASVMLGLLVAGCTTNVKPAAGDTQEQAVEQARDQVRVMVRETLDRLYAKDPAVKRVVEGAAGYAVFSNFGTKIMLAGGGSGRGLAFDNRTQREVFMRMVEVQAGLGVGMKKFRQVWVFDNEVALRRFISTGIDVGGQGTVAAKAGNKGTALAGAVSVSPGVWLYQMTDTGVAAELTFKGTKYYRDDKLN